MKERKEVKEERKGRMEVRKERRKREGEEERKK